LHLIPSNEKDLVICLNDSNEAAFEELYQSYSPRLFSHLLKLVKNETLASELLQETFIKIWVIRKNIDPNQSFRSYLFRIAENNVYDFFRKAARDKKLQQQLLSNSHHYYTHVEENICKREEVQMLREVIDLLPPRRQQVFQMIKMEERSYEEVSRIMNISLSSISDHIVKANKFIVEQLKGSEVTAMAVLILLLF
jgi:RNA polymerase sigma-70 factor (ECF subfamily)